VAAVALGQDWPQWRGGGRDGKVQGFTAPEKWPAALTQKWKVAVGAGDATPALVGDKLYVAARQGEEEVTLCLSAADGKELWRDKCPAMAVTGPAASHAGPRSSPAVADGKVVTLGVGGTLSCLEAATGKLLWRKDPFPKVTPRFQTAMSPMIVDGLCIAHLGGPGNGALMALDLGSGETEWQWAAEGPDYASPVLATVEGVKQIVTLSEKSVVGIAVADGKVLWQLPFVPQGRSYNSATPIVDGATVIFAAAGRGTTAVKIEKQGEAFAAKELWKNPNISVQFSSPVLKEGMLYGISDRTTLFCLNAQTSEAVWQDATPRGRGSFGAVLDAGAVMLALPSTSELLVFRPGTKEYTEVARLKLADTPTYAHPVVAGNRIFMKDADALAMWLIE
jgi:outer membrane protein assembly factor BamB